MSETTEGVINAVQEDYQDEKQAAIQGEAEISQQNAEQLLDFLGSASLNEDVATHEGQRVAQQSDSAAAAASCALVAAPAGAAATSPVTGGEASGAVAVTPAPSPGKEFPEPFPSASSGPTVAS